MRYRKLPQDVRQQITEYYEHRYRRKFFNEEAILNGLSQGLKEVRLNATSVNIRDTLEKSKVSLIQRHPLFALLY